MDSEPKASSLSEWLSVFHYFALSETSHKSLLSYINEFTDERADWKNEREMYMKCI